MDLTDKKRREKMREYQRKYYAANKDKERERKRKYRAAHKDEEREYQRKYYAANKDKERERKRKYRAAHKDEINKKPRAADRDKACNLSAGCRLTNEQIAIAREQIRKGLPINFKGK